MVLLSWLLVCALCAANSARGTAGEQAEPRLRVFSSLQRGAATPMPPYPVGMQLSLTCQVAGDRGTFWFEKKGDSDNPVELPSESNSDHGVQWSVYNIQHLAMSDHGREFWCMKDSSTMKEEVNLDVVGKPSPAEISSSIDTDVAVEAEIQCVAEGLSSQLELCWYKGNQKIVCQVPKIMSPSTQTVVTTRVGLPEILEETHTYLCKPQLRPHINTDSLTEITLHRFDTMFAEVSKKLEVVSHGAVPCNDTREQVRLTDAEEFVVVKSEQDNSKSCYRVAITEHRVPPPPPLGSSLTTKSTSRSPMITTTSSTPQYQQPNSSPARDGSSSAQAFPHKFSILLLLAVVLSTLW